MGTTTSKTAVKFRAAARTAKKPTSKTGKALLQSRKFIAARAKARAKKRSQRLRSKQKIAPKKLSLKAIVATYTVLVIFSAMTAVAVATSRHGQPEEPGANPFSASQIASAGFTLYYPAKLPAGYTLDRDALAHEQQQIINMRLGDPNNATITVIEQKTPQGFNYQTLYKTFAGRSETKTKNGTVTSGTIDDGRTYLSSLVTKDGSWLLMSSAEPLPEKDLKLIFDNFKSVR